ncbi:PLDc N-terminal domain-containing protein [Paraglaciecola sp.]|uniref:PLDc N-terminal domain-containing protein n=1 Tax=Paraglaciecola sp. TaxID=1920173 RepID=UPI003EF6C691
MFAFLGGVVFFIFWIIPVIAIIVSNRTRGGEKAAWILAVIFVSWFAWIFYLLLAPLKSETYRA